MEEEELPDLETLTITELEPGGQDLGASVGSEEIDSVEQEHAKELDRVVALEREALEAGSTAFPKAIFTQSMQDDLNNQMKIEQEERLEAERKEASGSRGEERAVNSVTVTEFTSRSTPFDLDLAFCSASSLSLSSCSIFIRLLSSSCMLCV